MAEADIHDLRVCRICKITKKISAFAKRKNWHLHKCKKCYSADRRENWLIVGSAVNAHRAQKRIKACKQKQTHEEQKAKRRAWALANREKMNAYAKQCRERNLEEYRKRQRDRETIRRKTVGGRHGFSRTDLDAMRAAQKNKCWYCSDILKNFHIEHRIPVSRGGPHELANIVLSCAPCNLRKGAKMPWEMENPQLI
jgi:5-methylcytosine-specific restriction endonuclease McrA